MCVKSEIVEVVAAPRSPWRRILKESLKPKLTRRVVNSAKVNLNKYWSKFEELTSTRSPLMTLEPTKICDNEMNDNTINERLDFAALAL